MNLYLLLFSFLSNRIFPLGSKSAVNIGYSTIMQTLSEISTLDQNKIQQIHLKYGDMGALSEYAISKMHTVSLFQHRALTLLSDMIDLGGLRIL